MSAPAAYVHSDVFKIELPKGVNRAHVLRMATHLERRSDPKGGGAAFASLANMAACCEMSEASAHRAMRAIRALGWFAGEVRANDTTRYRRTDKLDWSGTDGNMHRKLGIGARLDDLGLSPETLCLYLHYGLSTNADKNYVVRINDAKASRATGICRDNAAFHRELLVAGGLLQVDGRNMSFTPPEAWLSAADYATVAAALTAAYKERRAAARKRQAKTEKAPTSDTPKGKEKCLSQTPLLPVLDTPNCLPQTPKGTPLRQFPKVVGNDAAQTGLTKTLSDLLGKNYKWFCRQAAKGPGECALSTYLAGWTDDLLRRAWHIIEREPTARERPGIAQPVARLFALLDLLTGQLRRDDPPALHALRAEVEQARQERLQPKITLPLSGSVVRHNGVERIVDSAAGGWAFLVGVDYPVDPRECESVEQPKVGIPDTPVELPWFARARENGAQPRAQ